MAAIALAQGAARIRHTPPAESDEHRRASAAAMPAAHHRSAACGTKLLRRAL